MESDLIHVSISPNNIQTVLDVPAETSLGSLQEPDQGGRDEGVGNQCQNIDSTGKAL